MLRFRLQVYTRSQRDRAENDTCRPHGNACMYL